MVLLLVITIIPLVILSYADEDASRKGPQIRVFRMPSKRPFIASQARVQKELLLLNEEFYKTAPKATNLTYPPCTLKCPSKKLREFTEFAPEGECKDFWPFVHLRDNHETQVGSRYADSTMPCIFELAPSRIPDAGKGVFTKIDLPAGIIAGPYEGVEYSDEEIENSDDNHYVWSLQAGNGKFRNLDGKDKSKSNWLRYVNGARFWEEQNMYALEDGESKDVWYVVFKDIPAGEELLIFYGYDIGSDLGYHYVNEPAEDEMVDYLIAPKRSEMTACPTCSGKDEL